MSGADAHPAATSGNSPADTLRQLLAFAKAPTPPGGPMLRGRERRRVFSVVLAVDIAVAALMVAVVAIAEGFGATFPQVEDFDLDPLTLAIFAIAVAPVMEEVIFRGWLRGRRADLEFAATFVALILATTGLSYLDAVGEVAIGGVVVLGVIVAWLRWLATRKAHTAVPAWFSRHYGKIIYASSLVFGMIHLTNYAELQFITVFLVLPQTIGGLILAFTRTRLGLGAAILQHALFNALFTALDPWL